MSEVHGIAIHCAPDNILKETNYKTCAEMTKNRFYFNDKNNSKCLFTPLYRSANISATKSQTLIVKRELNPNGDKKKKKNFYN